MPAILTSFSKSKNYDPNKRPMALVRLIGPGGTPGSTYPCLVDTGADYTVLPLFMTRSTGIVITGTRKPIITIGGSKSFYFETGISLEVEGYSVITDLFFDPSPSAAYLPSLGRKTLLDTFDIGFNVNEWLYD